MPPIKSTLVATALAIVTACGVCADPPKGGKEDEAPRKQSRQPAGPASDKPLADVIAELKDPKLVVRRTAAIDLGRRGGRAAAAVPALVDALKTDKEPAMRATAAETLGAIGLLA